MSLTLDIIIGVAILFGYIAVAGAIYHLTNGRPKWGGPYPPPELAAGMWPVVFGVWFVVGLFKYPAIFTWNLGPNCAAAWRWWRQRRLKKALESKLPAARVVERSES